MQYPWSQYLFIHCSTSTKLGNCRVSRSSESRIDLFPDPNVCIQVQFRRIFTLAVVITIATLNSAPPFVRAKCYTTTISLWLISKYQICKICDLLRICSNLRCRSANIWHSIQFTADDLWWTDDVMHCKLVNLLFSIHIRTLCWKRVSWDILCWEYLYLCYWYFYLKC